MAFSHRVQMLPFEIREQLNLTLARPYLTFKPRARKRDCTPDISNIVVFNRYTYPVTNTPTSNLSALQLPTFSRGQTTRSNNEHLSSSLLRVELFATKRDEKRVKENLARRVKRGYKGERNDDARRLKGIHPKLRELVRISTFASYLAISGGCLSLTGGGTSPLHSKFATLAASTWPSLQWGRAKITGLFRRAATLETLAHCRLIVPSRIVTSSSAGSTDRYDVRNVI